MSDNMHFQLNSKIPRSFLPQKLLLKIKRWVVCGRVGHFLKKVGNSSGAVWISFTYVSSSTKKKELNLYLIFRPRCQTREIFKGNALKIQRDIDIFSFSEFLLIISDQKWFLSRYIKMSDQAGSFDTHIVIDCDISGPS